MVPPCFGHVLTSSSMTFRRTPTCGRVRGTQGPRVQPCPSGLSPTDSWNQCRYACLARPGCRIEAFFPARVEGAIAKTVLAAALQLRSWLSIIGAAYEMRTGGLPRRLFVQAVKSVSCIACILCPRRFIQSRASSG